MPTDPLRAEREHISYRDESSAAGVVTGAVKPDPPPAPPPRVEALAETPRRLPVADLLMSADDRLRAMGTLRDLLPCPLCGGDPLSAAERNPESGNIVAKIFCSRCTLVLSRCLAPSQEEEAREAVKARWNLRPAPARPWTYCADALPTEAGRYEVAAIGPGGSWFIVRAYFNGERDRWAWSWASDGVGGVYAWRPVAADPPPLRPADRAYLRAQAVPEEWLKEEG